jgi:hypothetical protein
MTHIGFVAVSIPNAVYRIKLIVPITVAIPAILDITKDMKGVILPLRTDNIFSRYC